MLGLVPDRLKKVYSLSAPLGTHWRRATCEQVGCSFYLNGFAVTVLPGSREEQVVKESGRKWSAVIPQENGSLRYEFPAGTKCFQANTHVVRSDAPLLFASNDRLVHKVRRFANSADWVDDFAEHQQRLSDAYEKGY